MKASGGFRCPVAAPMSKNNQISSIPFPRLLEEPAADYAALLHHRDLGPGRTLSQASAVTGLSESTLRRMAKRWDWTMRLDAYDAASLQRIAAAGAQVAEDRHRQQLLVFREVQRRRANRLATAAEHLMDLVVESVRSHLSNGTLLQPGQLGTALTAAARALEASGSTAATVLGIDELLEELIGDDHQRTR